MNGNQPVGAPDPTDPLANPVPAQRIPDPTPEDFLNWVHEKFGSYIQEQPPARVPPPKMTGGQVWDLQHATGPLQQLMTERLLMKDPAYRDYMTKQAAYEEHQKQLRELAPMIGAGVRGQAMRDVAGMRDESALQRQGWVKVQDINGEWTWIRNPNVPSGAATPQTSGQPPIGMATPSPTPEPSMKVRPGTPSNVSSAPGQSLNVLRSGVRSALKAPGAPKTLQTPQGPMQWSITKQAWEPATDVGGNRLQPPMPSNLAGIQEQLDSADNLRQEMKRNYQAGPPGMAARARGTAVANMTGGEWGRALGLAGYGSAFDPHAVQHERRRGVLAAALQFPLTGSRRAMEGGRQAILAMIPNYSDPPNVWEEFDRQVSTIINNARRMPWGQNPEGSADQMRTLIDQAQAAVESVRGTPAGSEQPFSGKTLHEADFRNAKPGERERFVAGGGTVVP